LGWPRAGPAFGSQPQPGGVYAVDQPDAGSFWGPLSLLRRNISNSRPAARRHGV